VAGLADIGDGRVASIPPRPPRQDSTAEARSLVVELFGPAGAGKTTFAHALHQALRAAGHRCEVVSSARPAERTGAPPASLRRLLVAPLSRASKVFGAVAELRSSDAAGERLLAQFPPRSPLSHLRSRRYLARLGQALSARRAPGTIVILDQGYLSALCSLAARSGLAAPGDADGRVAAALDLVPRADLVVWVETPGAVLRERLADRLARQAPAERLFEMDLATLAEQARLAEVLRRMMPMRGRAVLQVQGHVGAGPNQDATRIVQAVSALATAGPGAGAMP
jgi:thymidylate kinase